MAQVRIFVSHSHQDNAWCRPLVATLKAVGYDVWYDETGLTGGAAWVASIQREVQARDVFLLVLTPDAWASQWVQDELQLAIATRRRILPLLLRNTQVDGFLLTTQWVTVIGEEPPVAARSIIIAIEAPPAPGRNAAPVAATETLDELVMLCRSLTNERRYTEALSACGRALALDPNNIEVLRLKGWVLLKINDPLKAGEAWGRMLSHAPSERVEAMAKEVGDWLYERQSNTPSYRVGDCLVPLIRQLTSGPALYTLLVECYSEVMDANLRQVVHTRDSSMLRAALDFSKDRGSVRKGVSDGYGVLYDKDGWVVAFLAEVYFGQGNGN